jgi:hypothetical protein
MYWQGDYPNALAEFRRVLADRLRVCGGEHVDTLESRKYAALAAVNLDQQVDRAQRELRRVLIIQVEKLGCNHPYTMDTRAWLAQLDRPRSDS